MAELTVFNNNIKQYYSMGAEPWFYSVPYQADILEALQALRKQEFEAGRYFQDEILKASGRLPATLEELPAMMRESGTRSILDVTDGISETPNFCTVSPVTPSDLMEFFETEHPSLEQVKESGDLFESIDRGQGVYVIAYTGDQPSEICFAGYSFD